MSYPLATLFGQTGACTFVRRSDRRGLAAMGTWNPPPTKICYKVSFFGSYTPNNTSYIIFNFTSVIVNTPAVKPFTIQPHGCTPMLQIRDSPDSQQCRITSSPHRVPNPDGATTSPPSPYCSSAPSSPKSGGSDPAPLSRVASCRGCSSAPLQPVLPKSKGNVAPWRSS